MSISVIIPTYNRHQTLGLVLPYYLTQEAVQEILVIDDGSNPPVTTDILPKDSRIRLVSLAHQGPEHARNYGIDYSQGQFIFLGEDDAYPAADLFQHLLSRMTDADAVGCRAVHLPSDHQWPQSDANIPISDSSKADLYDVRRLELNVSGYAGGAFTTVPYTTAWALLKKSVLGTQIRFDESLKGNFYRDETDLWIALNAAGLKVAYDPHAVIFHIPRSGGGCHTMSRFEYEFWAWWNTYRTLDKHRAYLTSQWGYHGHPLLNSLHYEARRVENAIARRIFKRNVGPLL